MYEIHCIHTCILCCCIYIFLYSWPAICIHGDKAQNEREWVMSGKYKFHMRFTCTYACTFSTLVHVHVCVILGTCKCTYFTQFRNTTLVAHNNFQQMLTFKHSLFAILHRKPMKFGIQEDQLMFLLDTKVSLLPV